MGSADFHRVREIFTNAREVPEAGRAAFVERECGADQGLRREIEGLLAAEGPLGSEAIRINAADALKTIPDSRADPRSERIGPYRILGLLGEGGFGIVYLA